jgi:hypothetical protein
MDLSNIAHVGLFPALFVIKVCVNTDVESTTGPSQHLYEQVIDLGGVGLELCPIVGGRVAVQDLPADAVYDMDVRVMGIAIHKDTAPLTTPAGVLMTLWIAYEVELVLQLPTMRNVGRIGLGRRRDT